MADIIAPERAHRAAGPGLSYWLGSKVVNAPLAMEAGLAARLQAAIKDKAFDPQLALAPLASRFVGQRAGESGYRVTDDGIAILSIAGVLLDRGSWLGDLGGWATTYEGLAEQVRRIAKDDAIKDVVLDIDSGGGMAAGLFEACGVIRDLRKSKRITGIAANMAASAAYALGCTADELYVTQTGMAGSIGVITLHMSYADMLAQAGMEATIIHAGSHKPNGNPYQALSHNARAEMSGQCDQLYADFVAHVARERGLDEAKVRATEARVYTGDKAVSAGLADGVKSFDDVLVHIRAQRKKGGRPRKSVSTTAATTTGDPGMSGQTNSGDRPDYDAMIAAALTQIAASKTPAQPPAPAAPAAPAAAATDGRARVKAILTSEAAKGRTGLAEHLAYDTDMSADAALALLAKAPAEQAAADPKSDTQAGLATALEKQMAKAGNAAGIKPDAETPKGSKSEAAVSSTIAFMDRMFGPRKQ